MALINGYVVVENKKNNTVERAIRTTIHGAARLYLYTVVVSFMRGKKRIFTKDKGSVYRK